MKIKKFRISDYRSILDSKDVWLEENITILAGKNESGKTAILEALEDFDTSRPIRLDSIPVYNPQLKPEISITFVVSIDELNKTLMSIGVEEKIGKDAEIEIIKTYPNSYHLADISKDWLSKEVIESRIRNLKKSATNILNKFMDFQTKSTAYAGTLPDLAGDIDVVIKQFSEYKQTVETVLSSTHNEDERGKFAELTTEIDQIFSEIKKKSDIGEQFIQTLTGFLPNFVYFSSFDNLLPFNITLSEANNNKAVTNFLKIADVDLTFLQDASNDLQAKINHLSRKSTTITGEFLDYWHQGKVELHATLSGTDLVFGFKEEGKSEQFKMEQRSKGLQWFLAFYILLQLQQAQEKQTYLLVDEPGLYLHAKAQRDVLSVLGKRSKETPVIFSTHSPYLLEADNLNRVRLVFRDKEKGTIVESKFHKISDQETLTPVLTAIGLELTSGITNPDKLNNVIVEGPSDWYYLTAFKKVLGIENLNFIYGGGTGNMPNVGTILRGWGCKVMYLFDNDQGKRDGQKNMTKNWLIEEEQIKSISIKKDVRIEDLFTRDDFKKFVLKDTNTSYESGNSEYLASVKKDKVLISKLFLSEIESISKDISSETKDSFHKVLEIMVNSF